MIQFEDNSRNSAVKNRLYPIPSKKISSSKFTSKIDSSYKSSYNNSSVNSKIALKLIPIANFSKMVRQNKSYLSKHYLDRLFKEIEL